MLHDLTACNNNVLYVLQIIFYLLFVVAIVIYTRALHSCLILSWPSQIVHTLFASNRVQRKIGQPWLMQQKSGLRTQSPPMFAAGSVRFLIEFGSRRNVWMYIAQGRAGHRSGQNAGLWFYTGLQTTVYKHRNYGLLQWFSSGMAYQKDGLEVVWLEKD